MISMPDVDAKDTCSAKLPQTDRVDSEISVSVCVNVCVAAYMIIWGKRCLASFQGGVLNDSDTHPFMGTG